MLGQFATHHDRRPARPAGGDHRAARGVEAGPGRGSPSDSTATGTGTSSLERMGAGARGSEAHGRRAAARSSGAAGPERARPPGWRTAVPDRRLPGRRRREALPAARDHRVRRVRRRGLRARLAAAGSIRRSRSAEPRIAAPSARPDGRDDESPAHGFPAAGFSGASRPATSSPRSASCWTATAARSPRCSQAAPRGGTGSSPRSSACTTASRAPGRRSAT